MAYVAALVVVAFGCFCVILLVACARQNRDDAGLDEQCASLAQFRARRTETRRDSPTNASVAAIDPQARVSVWDDSFI